MPWIGFVFVMGHMSINHIYRQFANAPDMVDITGKPRSSTRRATELRWSVAGAQMVLVMKVGPLLPLSKKQVDNGSSLLRFAGTSMTAGYHNTISRNSRGKEHCLSYQISLILQATW